MTQYHTKHRLVLKKYLKNIKVNKIEGQRIMNSLLKMCLKCVTVCIHNKGKA